MKLDFESISIKNFFSYGAKTTTLNFKESPLTLISGANGKGKSTLIVESIFFALFGKPSREIKIKSVINDINKKNCVVDLKFTVNDKLSCRIVRGLNPDFLEFYKGEEKEDSRSSKKLMQKEIDNFLQINPDTLRNVCVLSSNQSIPFLDMKPHEVRPVIENIFKTYVYSQMLNEIKNHRSNTVDKIRSIEQDLKLFNGVIEDYKNSMLRMKNLKDNFGKEKQEKIIQMSKDMGKIFTEIESLNKKINDVNYSESIKEVREQIKQLEMDISKLDSDIIHIKENIDKLNKKKDLIENNNTCPICSSELTLEHKEKEIGSLTLEIHDLTLDLEQKGFDLISKKDSKKKFDKKLSDIINDEMENNELKDSKKELESELKSIEKNIESVRLDTIDKHLSNIIDINKVKEYVEKKKLNESNLCELQKDLTYSDTIKNILSDDGVKSAVIKRDLPYLNTKLNEYLRLMGFNLNIEFNETFDFIVTNIRKAGYQYQSFSNGQKKRIDLAILLSFIDLAKRKNSFSSNILVLDEICDTSLDSDGIENFLGILGVKIKAENLNVFLISHKKDINLNNCKRIEIYQEGEFSAIR